MAQHFRLASWIVDPDRNTFTGNGRTVKVEPKIMEVCVRLAQAPGSVVSKGELLESVWQDISVGEDALTRAISELRRALEDDARNPRIVETIPKRGYRLIAAVEVAASEAPVESGRVPPAYARLGHAALLAAALGALLIPAGVFWLRSVRVPFDQ